MSGMFSITARVCARMSSFVTPISSTSTPTKLLSGRRELVPETKTKSPARLTCGNLPRGLALPATTVPCALCVFIVAPRRWGWAREVSSSCTPASQPDADVGRLGIEVERVAPALAPDARQLRAAEGRAQVAREPGVDPDDADVEAARDPVRTRQVGRPHAAGQAVGGVVHARDHLVLAVERRDVAHRAER